jgi:serine/threonine-protein kinase
MRDVRVLPVKRARTPLTILVLANTALLLTLSGTSHRLPERVASHFDLSGVADGWMSRASHLWTLGTLACGLSAVIVILFYSVRFFPDSSINLPRRDYWLAPERREETYSVLFRSGIWFACLMVLFMFGMHLLVIEANAVQPPRMSDSVWLVVGGLMAAMGIWTYLLVRRFSRGQ